MKGLNYGRRFGAGLRESGVTIKGGIGDGKYLCVELVTEFPSHGPDRRMASNGAL